MSAILDILIVVIIGVTIGFAVKNGFVKTVLSAASFLIALVVAFLFVAPVRDAFGIVLLSPGQWGIVFAASLAVIPAAEIYKAVWRLIERKGKQKGKQKGARVSGARGRKRRIGERISANG